MKNHLTLFLIVLFSAANSQVKSPCGNVKKKAEPKKYLNLYDQVSFDEEINTYVLTKDWYTPFNGTGQTWNRGGFVLEEITCVNGKRDGSDTSYYSSGCIKAIQRHIIGIKNGAQQFFYDSTGQLTKEETYLNGKLNGISKEFNRNGDTILFMNFRNDIREGIQREYFPDGKRSRILSYKNGVLDGTHITFNAEGKVEVSLSYKEGKKNGKQTYFYSNGKEAGIEMWTMDQKDGDFITYNETGLILAKSTFKKDIAVGEHLVNDEKGKTIHQTIYDKKGAKQYEMEIDEYGDKKVLFDINKTEKTSGITEDDDPNDISPKTEKKNKRKKQKERRKKDKA